MAITCKGSLATMLCIGVRTLYVAFLQDCNVRTSKSSVECPNEYLASKTANVQISLLCLCLDVPSCHVIPVGLRPSLYLVTTTALPLIRPLGPSLFCITSQHKSVAGPIVARVSLLLVVPSVFPFVRVRVPYLYSTRFGPRQGHSAEPAGFPQYQDLVGRLVLHPHVYRIPWL